MIDEQVRVFVAIELSEDAKRYLANIQLGLQPCIPVGVKWARPGGIHLTLKFLGSIQSSLLTRLQTAVFAGSRNVHAFPLKICGLGVFPERNRTRIIWAGLTGDIPTLLRLQEGVDGAISGLGFGRETRPFSAHLTLGRVRETATLDLRRKIGGAVGLAQVVDSDSFEIRSVSIMRSISAPEGVVYDRLAAIHL